MDQAPSRNHSGALAHLACGSDLFNSMSICSKHREPDPDCRLCKATPHDLFPDWDEKGREAEAAGLTTCVKCGFEYYLTTHTCPKCSHRYEPPGV